ncbi:M48 family metalloprotease [Methylobacterium nonmethylotrophicum]|uniref:Peptidase M48 domain-containing protein n=1 Tax=Methylobacterium nonmethylotrophicum TaxID=1141884 RepID=A0A4Z0NX58_9HYPH|nr:M48 family metalloprotease [Methylobacterium nonmethylotrophicum]TGE02245.1 hypothetical protein EU555_00210 [Methylobacterium nonmethylotrophicum]
MVLRVNGLFGWVRANDRRSIALFGGLILAINVGAALFLLLPLLAVDPDHAPVTAWGGYARRYVPLVTLAAGAVFALHLMRHVRSVQRLTGFAFVDDADEPRLCRLVEPLAIGMGLPAPYVGVIEARALNAFACGLGRRDAVVVVTRGLIDALDDEELAAVLAHELAHIVNGDIRLLAAADAGLRLVGWLARPPAARRQQVGALLSLPVIMAVLPPLFVFILIAGICGQAAIRGSRLIRLMISSSREFIADACAVEATQNPAALVSALRRIDGRSRLNHLPPGQDAMMIDGASEGGFATHPTIARRIAVIVAVTGSMALNAPKRRDTRSPDQRDRAACAIRTGVFGAAPPASERGTPDLVDPGDARNWLGFTPVMTLGAVLAVAVFLGMHRHDLHRPAALAAALDPRPAGILLAVVGREFVCNAAFSSVGLALRATGLDRPVGCDAAPARDLAAAQTSGSVGRFLAALTEPPAGLSMHPNGTFGSAPSPATEAETVRTRRCFRTKGYARGDGGLHAVDAPPRRDGAFDIGRWLAGAEAQAVQTAAAGPEAGDRPLDDYLSSRKSIVHAVDRYFGEPGLAMMRRSFASPSHQRAIGRLRERLGDPRWAAGLPPVRRAEFTLLANSPEDFVTCSARDRMDRKATVPPT